jgi:hypothetical protein
VVVLAVLLLSITWCIPHLGVSCADLNSRRIGAIVCNTNSGSSSHNSNSSSCCYSSSIMLLLHRRSRLPLGHHSSFPPTTFHASIAGRWGTLLVNAASPSKATHHELRHSWSINKGANKGVLHHRLAAPTKPLCIKFPREKNC